MNAPLLPTMDACGTFVATWLLLIGVAVRLKLAPATRAGKLALAAAAGALLLVPVNGLPLWSWVFSCYPNPCLPMLGLLLARRAPRFIGVAIFARPDWNAIWWFGAVAGTVIYVPALAGSPVDLYYWGWDASQAYWVLAGLAVAFLVPGNRLGVLLLGSLIAFAVSGLESSNCWDYVIDPVYWLASLIVLVRQGLGRGLAWMRERRIAVERHVLVPVAVDLDAMQGAIRSPQNTVGTAPRG